MDSERDYPDIPIKKPIALPPSEFQKWIKKAKPKRGDKVLDPFCGTGGILIEAGRLGCTLYGSDIDEKMIEYTTKNLKHFGLEAKLKVCSIEEVENVWDIKFDAIVTDPPYRERPKILGRYLEELLKIKPRELIQYPSVEDIKKAIKDVSRLIKDFALRYPRFHFGTMGGERIERLYRKSLDKFASLVKEGKICVIGAPEVIDFERIVKKDNTEFLHKEKIKKQIVGSIYREVHILERC